MKKKTKIRAALLVMIACAMLMCAVSSTMAWLQDQTDPVTNTFTPSHGDVELTETKEDFKMVPGWTIPKDPKVTVAADSEDCIVFVVITEKGIEGHTFDKFIGYEIATGWTKGNSENGVPANVYFRTVKKTDTVREFAVLKDNQVTVKYTVTEEMMDLITDKIEGGQTEEVDKPELTFTAYAVQLKNSNTTEFTPADAWAQVKPSNN